MRQRLNEVSGPRPTLSFALYNVQSNLKTKATSQESRSGYTDIVVVEGTETSRHLEVEASYRMPRRSTKHSGYRGSTYIEIPWSVSEQYQSYLSFHVCVSS